MLPISEKSWQLPKSEPAVTILDTILLDVRREVAEAKAARPASELEAMIADAPFIRDFHHALADRFGLIAEIKDRSPSVGPMRPENVLAAPGAYAASPIVHAISVLTNHTHFGGSIEHLAEIRKSVPQPVLRKDFIIDDYQLLEARAFGSDAVLLMANVLGQHDLQRLYDRTCELGMEALFEVHTEAEIALLPSSARIVGINSRKFKAQTGFLNAGESSATDFSLDLSAFDLSERLPAGTIHVAESGLTPLNLPAVASKFQAALVGTSLLRDPRGLPACLADFEAAINALHSAK